MEIQRNGSKLFYEKAGNGRKNILLFHGFGQTHAVFKPLTAALSQEFTCYSFDLFFHGRSTRASGEIPIHKDEWSGLIRQFLEQENISRFSILGYSIGARFALSTFEALPDKVETIVLVAPDGIVASPWYSAATSTSAGRMFFRTIMRNQAIFRVLTGFLQRSKIVDARVLRFAESQMKSEENRLRIYHSWIAFRKLKSNLKALTERINTLGVHVVVYFGRNDKIIESKKLRAFIHHVPSVKVLIVDRTHHTLLSHLPGNLLNDLQGKVIPDAESER
jgi:pimeloyl-ACP methyl ester carboxylesterase